MEQRRNIEDKANNIDKAGKTPAFLLVIGMATP